MCFMRLIKRVVCIWWCNQNCQHIVRTNRWAMHEGTCLKNVHVTSDIKEHVTLWSILDEKIWPILWGSWIHFIWWQIVRFLDRYINWLGPLRWTCIRWVLLDSFSIYYLSNTIILEFFPQFHCEPLKVNFEPFNIEVNFETFYVGIIV